jgi:hypothetical protein
MEGGAGTPIPKSANKSSLLTSAEIVFGATGRTLLAAAQGNALARGFCEAAQPEPIAAIAHSIAQRSFGETRDSSSERCVAPFGASAAPFGSHVERFGSNLASCDPRAPLDRDAATRTLSVM